MTKFAEDQFSDLVRSTLPWLHELARRSVGERADDVVQESLLKAYKGFGTLRSSEAGPAWLRTILINTANDRIRHDIRRQEDPSGDLDDRPSALSSTGDDTSPLFRFSEFQYLGALTTDDFWSVLDGLPAKYRVPLVLVHMEGFPTRYVARLFGEPIGTLLSHLHRGRRLLEEALEDYARDNMLLPERSAGGGT